MARRIQPIFDSILSDARLQGSGRSFVESLQAHYTRKKSLSPSQRRALAQIEDKLSAAPVSIGSERQSQLDSLIARATEAKDDWAVTFVTSLKGQLLMGRELSARQNEILDKVSKRHSDEAQAVREAWRANFTPTMRERMKIAARYYIANPPYFGEQARKVLSDDDYIPTEREYTKMVDNKYAAKVIASTLAEPKFQTGSHVQLRSMTNGLYPRALKETIGVVLKTDAQPVVSAACGTKIYSVLFFGQATPTSVEERWLKKGKL